MTDLAPKAKPKAIGSPLVLALTALIVVNHALRLQLLFRVNINWDEFHYLSYVYDYLRPAALSMRQTFHVHLFSWLPTVAPADEITQITVARVLFFLLGLATSLFIYLVARRLLSVEGALFSVLCYGSVADILVHASSFRPDPMLTLLVMATAWCVMTYPSRVWSLLAAGLMFALSFMLTPKTIFFLPTVVALHWLSPFDSERGDARARILRLVGLAGSAAGCWWILHLLHRSSLTPQASAGGELHGLANIAGKVLGTGILFPQRIPLFRSLEENLLVWILLATGIVVALLELRSGDRARRAMGLALVALVVPVVTVAFYRNSFPYYYVPILAPAVILSGATFDGVRRLRQSSRLASLLIWTVVAGIFGTTLAHFGQKSRDHQQGQRQILAAVHRMFPEPEPYIDRCSMVSSFPKVGFFMSTWGFESYLKSDRISLADIVREHAPPFLLANVAALDLNLPESLTARIPWHLKPEDASTLRQNYIYHWGIIFVAGKHLEIDGDGVSELSTLIPGQYTLEGLWTVWIDDVRVAPGDTVYLSGESQNLSGPAGVEVTLRWGDHLYRPTGPPPRPPIFIGL